LGDNGFQFMAPPPIVPSSLHLSARPFSFYPAIVAAPQNEWRLLKTTWQDWLVVNIRTGEELSIPRRFIGEVSTSPEGAMVVSLLRSLRIVNGAALPFERRVIEMPLAAASPKLRHTGPAQVVPIRLEPRRWNRIFQTMGGAMALVIFLYIATANLIRTAVGRFAPSGQLRARTLHDTGGAARMR
jgi:hypothetical protein